MNHKKNGCPDKFPNSQTLLYDHNSILKRSCARIFAQFSDHIKVFENFKQTTNCFLLMFQNKIC
jgi:hypothetical protein